MSGNKATDAVEILHNLYANQIVDLDQEVLDEELKVRVGLAIIKMRKEATITQQQLAESMGITQSMVSQLENADYDDSALDMLWRACKVLQKRLNFNCEESERSRRRSSTFQFRND